MKQLQKFNELPNKMSVIDQSTTMRSEELLFCEIASGLYSLEQSISAWSFASLSPSHAYATIPCLHLSKSNVALCCATAGLSGIFRRLVFDNGPGH
jgi:hypothetical protein